MLNRPVGTLFLLLSFFTMLVSGCTSTPKLENQAVLQLNNNLAQLTQWKLSGKIAWIGTSERKSAYINWQQDAQELTFTLTNVLGISGGKLSYDGVLASLYADGEIYTDPSPSFLIYKTTGFDIPIKSLQSWIKGAAYPSGRQEGVLLENDEKVDTIARYENGLIQKLVTKCSLRRTSCSPWQIDYESYVNVKINEVDYQLPSSIRLLNLNTQDIVKIKVNKWSQ